MAANETDIKVVIAAELKKQGFDKAQKATSSLEKSFKKLGGTLATVFAAQKIVAFGKASLKAFADDEAAARRLTQTLNNLNLGFEDPRIKAYLTNLEQTTGVLDDKLRPALQSLLTTTGSVTKSQELLGLAIDVAAGSGVDLQTVAQDLSAAYVGNTKGLKKYNLGLTQAELKSASFSDVQKKLNQQFSGQNAAYLETYAGKVAILGVAFENVKETVGKGLADAFILLAGEGGIGAATSAMEEFATKTSNAIYGVAVLLDKLNTKFGKFGGRSLGEIIYATFGGGFIDALAKIGQENLIAPKPFSQGMSVTGATDFYDKQERARKAAEEAAAKRAKALAALQKKAELDRIKREKDAQALKRAGTVFDMENIQIVAAMQGRISDEQRLRLIALLAINNDMADAADKTTRAILAIQAPALQSLGITISTSDNATTVIEKLIKAQTQLVLVNNGITTLPKAKNPFEDWDTVMKNIIANLDTIAAKIKGMPSASATTGGGGGGVGGGGGGNNGSGNTQLPPSIAVTPAQFGAAMVGIGIPAGFENTSLASDANLLSSARYQAQQNAIMEQFAFTNNLRAAQYEAMQRLYPGRQVSDTMTSDYQSFRAGERGDIIVNVSVAGNVTTETDLVEAIRDSLYNFQKSGGLINIETVAI